MNLGVAFGAPLVQVARSFAANGLNAINVVWLSLMLTGSVPNILYWACSRVNGRIVGRFPSVLSGQGWRCSY
jgi:hypothetical protein